MRTVATRLVPKDVKYAAEAKSLILAVKAALVVVPPCKARRTIRTRNSAMKGKENYYYYYSRRMDRLAVLTDFNDNEK